MGIYSTCVISGFGLSCSRSGFASCFPFSIGAPFTWRPSIVSCQWCRCRARHSSQEHEGVSSSDRKKMFIESLWREFFSDPSLWWSNRSEKVNARYPDFKHKKKPFALWLNSNLTPPWVEAKLAAMAPDSLQKDVFSWNKQLERCCKAGKYEETIKLYQQMKQEGIGFDKFTYIPVLNACSHLGALEHGERIHE